MEIAGYIASILIGISLGLIGGGGSILTVPVLVYLFSVEPASATVYSLFIVGTTSFVGSVSYIKKKELGTQAVLFFGIPSIVTVFLTRIYIVTAIPNHIFSIGHFTVTKDIFLMLLFAVLMIAASYSMIKKNNRPVPSQNLNKPFKYPVVIAQGLFTGIITGLIGAGGGFLIIPVLVNFLRMPMKRAVGTSLLIITLNSSIGFLFSVKQVTIQWHLLLIVTVIAVVGILIGSYISTKTDGNKLKPLFGWFVLLMGVYIILKETIIK